MSTGIQYEVVRSWEELKEILEEKGILQRGSNMILIRGGGLNG
jgi:hypothetical protein